MDKNPDTLEKVKTCSKCKTPKLAECFSRNSSSSDGLQYACKDCYKIYHSAEGALTCNRCGGVKAGRSFQYCNACLLPAEKFCPGCKSTKPGADFFCRKLPSGRPGLKSRCRVCELAAHAKWRTRPESRQLVLKCQKKRYAANPEAFKERVREYRKKNPEKVKAALHAHYLANKEKVLAQTKKWRADNPERYSETRKRGARQRYAKSPQARIVSALRTRLRGALNGRAKAGPTLELLGCPPVWLEAWLESLFRPGMSLANHGTVWHIDHIKPCAAFDLRDPEQQRICFHWTNLQPLFVRENLSKGDKYG